mmetsp:Transcript_2834/g.5230  ORF Transcript_2834/g.5230 Transcript_2834/m.5230 type:complete len:234 (-) Transcript_2834:947-1648(-)
MTSAYGSASVLTESVSQSVLTDAPTNPAVPFRFGMLSTAPCQSRRSGVGPTSLPPPEQTRIYSFLQQIIEMIDSPSVDSAGTDDDLSSISESNESNETIHLKNTTATSATSATSTKYRKGPAFIKPSTRLPPPVARPKTKLKLPSELRSASNENRSSSLGSLFSGFSPSFFSVESEESSPVKRVLEGESPSTISSVSELFDGTDDKSFKNFVEEGWRTLGCTGMRSRNGSMRE